MAMEGLFTRLGPSLIRELSPHLLQLANGFLERFRKDTSAMKASVDAEIVSLRQTQASLAATAAQQAEAVTSLTEQLSRLEQKIDRLQQSSEDIARQLATIEQQAMRSTRIPVALVWSLLAVTVATLGATVRLLLMHP